MKPHSNNILADNQQILKELSINLTSKSFLELRFIYNFASHCLIKKFSSLLYQSHAV